MPAREAPQPPYVLLYEEAAPGMEPLLISVDDRPPPPPLRGGGARHGAAPHPRRRPTLAAALRLRHQSPGLPRLHGLRPRLETRRGLRRRPDCRTGGVPGKGRVRGPRPAAGRGGRHGGGDGSHRGAHRRAPDGRGRVGPLRPRGAGQELAYSPVAAPSPRGSAPPVKRLGFPSLPDSMAGPWALPKPNSST